MRIDDPGNDRAPAQVDDRGVEATQLLDVCGRADRFDSGAVDSNAPGLGAAGFEV